MSIVALCFGLIIVATIFGIWMFKGGAASVEWWKTLGYPGVFLLSLLASGGLVLPIPSMAAVCGAAGLNLNLIAVGFLSGLGETIGEISGYAIGYGGRSVIENRDSYKKIRRWVIKRGSLVLLVVSAIPNPFFDVVGIAAGGLRYPIGKFLAIVWVGKTTKGLAMAYTCYWVVQWVMWLR